MLRINSIEYLDKEMFDRGIKNYIQNLITNLFTLPIYKKALSIIHQISIMGFKNIIKLLNETQMNKANLEYMIDPVLIITQR